MFIDTYILFWFRGPKLDCKFAYIITVKIHQLVSMHYSPLPKYSYFKKIILMVKSIIESPRRFCLLFYIF